MCHIAANSLAIWRIRVCHMAMPQISIFAEKHSRSRYRYWGHKTLSGHRIVVPCGTDMSRHPPRKPLTESLGPGQEAGASPGHARARETISEPGAGRALDAKQTAAAEPGEGRASGRKLRLAQMLHFRRAICLGLFFMFRASSAVPGFYWPPDRRNFRQRAASGCSTTV